MNIMAEIYTKRQLLGYLRNYGEYKAAEAMALAVESLSYKTPLVQQAKNVRAELKEDITRKLPKEILIGLKLKK
jgi:hypothetical protein